MGLAVGSAAAIQLRLLGAARTIPLSDLRRIWPLTMAGLAVAVASGLVLVIAYPAKALTNPLFYAKLAAVAAALILTQRLATLAPIVRAEAFGRLKLLAAACLALWAFGVIGGRFLAYTHKMLLVY